MSDLPQQILIIKHGALGDIILATGPMAAIRAQHPDAHIVLLTTPTYAKLLKKSPYADEIWTDSRPKLWNIKRMFLLIKQLNSIRFDYVYDLQTSARSTMYFDFFLKKPLWSGLAKRSPLRHNTPERTTLHTIDRQKQQLAIAGIEKVPAPSIAWMTADVSAIAPNEKYAILVPGGSAHRPEKRWPHEHYIALARWLVSKQIKPVLIGANAETHILHAIEDEVPKCLNLCNMTGFEDLAEIARGARYAIGNDTGPMHIIAAAGCPSVVLFSPASNPDLCAPRGDHVSIIRSDNLATLTPEAVQSAIKL